MTDTTYPHQVPAPSAGALRERARLWRAQTAFSAVQAAGTIGLVWLSATEGGGPLAAALIIAASVLPVALGAAPAAWLVAHASRRTLLWTAQLAALVALIGAAVVGADHGAAPLVAAIAVVGSARAVFDAVSGDVLSQLVAHQRTHEAMRDLTRRFGLGQVIGLAGTMVTGLLGGPIAAVWLAVALAAVGTVLALGHDEVIDLRPEGATPLHHGLRAGAALLWREPQLRAAVGGGAVSVAIGAALSACLILWLRDGVGLRGTLVPTLMVGLLLVRIARPVLVRVARRVSSRTLAFTALGIQAGAALVAHEAGGMFSASAAYALSLASGAFLATLITRAHTRAAPPVVAPAVAQACSAAWALAAAAGATVGAVLAVTVGMADAYLVLAAVALGAAAVAVAPAVMRRRGSSAGGA